MKALSLRQPWATLMARGIKGAETRSWRTSYRGQLAIHASKIMDASDRAFVAENPKIAKFDYPLASVICIVELVACVPTAEAPKYANAAHWSPPVDWKTELRFGNFEIGRWAWLTRLVRVLETPIAAKGALSVWDWEPPGIFD
jgi:activating signal cointegrator 1